MAPAEEIAKIEDALDVLLRTIIAEDLRVAAEPLMDLLSAGFLPLPS